MYNPCHIYSMWTTESLNLLLWEEDVDASDYFSSTMHGGVEKKFKHGTIDNVKSLAVYVQFLIWPLTSFDFNGFSFFPLQLWITVLLVFIRSTSSVRTSYLPLSFCKIIFFLKEGWRIIGQPLHNSHYSSNQCEFRFNPIVWKVSNKVLHFFNCFNLSLKKIIVN